MEPNIPVWRPFRGPFERWPNLTDLAIALFSFMLNLLMWSHDSNVLAMATLLDVGVYLCAFIGNFALLWRRSHPWQVHSVILTVSIVLYLVGPVDGIVAMMFSLYSLGRYESVRRASLAGVIAAFAFVVADLRIISTPSAGATVAAMMVLALWYVGRRLRFRGEYLRLLEERAQYLEREKNSESERAVVAERTRIAREMHDIVAHQVSLMTVQAGAARTVNASDPQAASEAMASVEAAGRHALSEMRHLLDVLRPVNVEDVLTPQPGIDELPKLVRQVRGVGFGVELQTKGDLHSLPARLDLTIYRIVQEALTNVIKHAGASANVSIVIEGRSEDVVVSIKDDGRDDKAVPGSGHGIVGMRERVQLLRGSLAAEPGVNGGFEVRAILPREAKEK